MSEIDIMRAMQVAASQAGNRLFRNNTAVGWVGQLAGRPAGGTVVLKNARVLHAGLCVGSSDLIGWTRVLITPEMVGQVKAIFNATEAKSAIGRPTPEQIQFINAVRASGGLAGIARTIEQMQGIANGHIHD